MSLSVLTIGDDFTNSATLYTGSTPAAYDVSTATSVKAIITNRLGTQAYTDTVTLSSGATGADWANGVIVYNFTAAVTAAISSYVTVPEIATLETQVELSDGTKFSWFADVHIRPGNVA